MELKKRGLEAWTERFDHIDDHFMGKNGKEKVGIGEWISIDNNKPKGDLEALTAECLDKESQGAGSESSGNTSPKSTSSEEEISDPTPVAAKSSKRNRGSSDEVEPNRQVKHQKTAGSSKESMVMSMVMIYCVRVASPQHRAEAEMRERKLTNKSQCQCDMPHNPKLNESCTSCSSSHRFCSNCVTKSHRVNS